MSGLRLTPAWVAEAVHGTLVAGDPQGTIGNVVIDSRTLQAGDFFVAIRGERFDAHDFVDEVIASGAAGVLVHVGRGGPTGQGGRSGLSGRGGESGVVVIEVADTTRALQDLAHAVRVASGTRVIAITGSAGKTTTKETIAAFLSGTYRVVKNRGNLNNHIGLPLSLMQLREQPEVAVMELGMNHAGEISTLVAIADPEVRVWTNVGDAHIGFFASADAIADAKAEILEGAGADDVLVYNADDQRIVTRARTFAGRTLTFGVSPAADVRAVAIEDLGADGMRALLETPAGGRGIRTPLLGRGSLANVLAAVTVALEFGVPLDDVAAAAARLVPPDRRGAVKRLRDGVTLIDDSYNSSPAALAQALDVLARDARSAQKVAVIGEMLELGDHAPALHRNAGRVAAAAGLRHLFTVGGAPARALADAAIAAGMPSSSVSYIDSSVTAAPIVAADVRAGDLVLVKGSRGIRTDLIADRIAEEFA